MGLLLFYVAIKSIMAVCIGIGTYAFVRPIFSGAPYAVSTPRSVETMMRLLGSGNGRRAVDLGSGDGRIVIALAQTGFEAHGFELNPILAFYSRIKIKRLGLQDRAFIHRRSYWDEPMARYDVVTVFGVTFIMGKLERKLRSELKPGSLIVCTHFTFPTWKPTKHKSKIFRSMLCNVDFRN
jgi:protein-L-isoaspartate O-methyltransferase